MIARGEKIALKIPSTKKFEDFRVETGFHEAPGVVFAVRRLRDGQRFVWPQGDRLKAAPG